MKIISTLLIALAIILYALSFYYIWLRDDANRLSFTQYSNQTIVHSPDLFPKRITIRSVNISLQIFPSQIVNKVWQTTDNGASYLITSPLPGSVGNSIIYAHNWAVLFGNLLYIKPGDEIDIKLADNKVNRFIVQNTVIVSPSDSGILKPSNKRQLTLYTCTGWLDSKRFVVIAYEHN